MLVVHGVPFDLCGPLHGSRLGPIALRLCDLEKEVSKTGSQIRDAGDVVPLDGKMPGSRKECDLLGLAAFSAVKAAVSNSVKNGDTPVVLGGDHSVSIGSVAGALEAHGDGLALLWIDAHADLNTPATTPSGNLHGMPIGALLGLPAGQPQGKLWDAELEELWARLDGLVSPKLDAARVGWIGLREVDPGEVSHMHHLQRPFVRTMQDLDASSVGKATEELGVWLRQCGATGVWVSFDVDVLDPFFAPGTGTAVRGGLTYREGHMLAETLHELLVGPEKRFPLVGMDLVEVNPVRDNSNETARVALEWLCSLFGKTILGLPDGAKVVG